MELLYNYSRDEYVVVSRGCGQWVWFRELCVCKLIDNAYSPPQIRKMLSDKML